MGCTTRTHLLYQTTWAGRFHAPWHNPANQCLAANFFRQASRLAAALHQSDTERCIAAKRRNQRLTNLRKLQDQLLHPPKLNSLVKTTTSANSIAVHSEDGVTDNSKKQLFFKRGVGKDWSVAEGSAQRHRAQRVHALAAAAARSKGNKVRIISKARSRSKKTYDILEIVKIRNINRTKVRISTH